MTMFKLGHVRKGMVRMRCNMEQCIHYGDCDFDNMLDVEQSSDCATFKKEFTEDDIDQCWPFHKDYLLRMLNRDYDPQEMRVDLASLVDSKYDPRIVHAKRLREAVDANKTKLARKETQ